MAISILHTFPSNHICKKKWDFIYSHKRQQLRNGTWNLLVTCLMSHHLEEKTKSRDCLIYSVNLISSGKIWPKCLFLHVRAEDYKNRNIVTHTHTHTEESLSLPLWRQNITGPWGRLLSSEHPIHLIAIYWSTNFGEYHTYFWYYNT
jgi:hypothetical protein